MNYSIFLTALYESVDGLSPYALFSRFGVSPFEVAGLIKEGEDLKEIAFDFKQMRIKITSKGRKRAKQDHYKKVKNHGRHAIPIPECFVTKQKELEDKYIPTLIEQLEIKGRERTSIEGASRFRFRVKAE